MGMKARTDKVELITDPDTRGKLLRQKLEGKKELVEVDLDDLKGIEENRYVGMLRSAIRLRNTAWLEEESVKVMKQQANDLLETAMEGLGIQGVGDEEFGSASVVEQTRYSLNKGRLMEELVKMGVDAQDVKECMDRASTESFSRYVRYSPPKGKKG
jgi:hypothetical protein